MINVAHSLTIGWPEQKHHFAQRSLTHGVLPGFLLVLSNLYPFSSRRSGVTMRRVPFKPSHLWAQGGRYALITVINLKPEPRISSSRTQRDRSHHGRTAQGMVGGVYTQGSIGVHIPGGCIPTIYTREAYPAIPTQGGIPGYTHPGRLPLRYNQAILHPGRLP